MVDKKSSSKIKGFNKSKKVVKSKLNDVVGKLHKKYANGFERPSVLLNLEARMMFDGAAPAAADEILDNANSQSPESLPNPVVEASADQSDASPDTDTNTDTGVTVSNESSLEVDGIADSLEVDSNASDNQVITTEEATDALAVDGVDNNANPLFGPSSAVEISADTSDSISNSNNTVQEQASSEEVNVDSSVDDVNDSDQSDDVDEATVEEPKVTRVVFIDTSVLGYEDLLNGVIQEIELGQEDDEIPSVESAVSVESADADAANTSNAPPATSDVPSNQSASNDSGADTSLEDAGYTANEDGAIIIDGVAIYLLDPADNQVQEITNILSEYSGLDAIDIISHGAVGEIQLGNQRINSETLSDYSDQISAWGDALAVNGDILLHGCNVAGSDDFLNDIAALTDADIAASDDDTGNAQFGGDFELEKSTGSIEAVSLLSADTASAFSGVLAPGDADDDGIMDIDDLDDDNDGILDVDEAEIIATDFTTTAVSQIPPNGGSTVLPHNVIDLSGFVNPATGLNYAIGDDVLISNIDARGDLNGAGETFDLTFNPGTGATESSLVNLNTGFQSNILNPVIQDVQTVVTLIDTGGGVAGLVIAGSTDPTVGTGFSGITDMAYNVTLASFTVNDIDTDGDGIFDRVDLDSDNDGVSDLQESGADLAVLDSNNNGIIDGGDFIDADSDGVADAVGSGTDPVDSDNDGIDDFRDLDSDNDGIADYIEGQSTSGYVEFNNADVDSDGIIDVLDADLTGHGGLASAEDTDSDGAADFQDLDSDNDSIADGFESGIFNSSGDGDSDGIDDIVNASYSNPDGDVTTDPATVIADNGTELDFRDATPADLDNDGIADNIDLDDDNDGILDTEETPSTLLSGAPGFEAPDLVGPDLIASNAGQYDPNADWSGGWTTPGTVDYSEGQYVVGSSTSAHTNAVTDGLQIIQSDSGTGGGFAIFSIQNEALTQTIPVVAGETYEVTFEIGLLPLYAGTGVTFNPDIEFGVLGSAGTNVDIEFDQTDHPAGLNTVADYPTSAVATAATQTSLLQLDPQWASYTFTFTADATGTVDIFARTLNGDAVVVLDDLTLSGLGVPDYDQDGLNNKDDLDSDNDGISDLQESGDAAGIALDLDNNGTISLSEGADSDSDGIMDIFEDGNLGPNTATDPVDSDSDGIDDYVDLDSDNDGIVDIVEGQSTAGYQDATNIDLDGDGAQDVFDTPVENSFGGQFDTPEDTDSDGVFDYLDTDSDSDGLSDTFESGLDALTGNDVDSDGLDDGIFLQGAGYDSSAGITSTSADLENTDGQVPDVDFRDTDSDSDGIADSLETTEDTDSDGTFDFRDTDADSDGIADSLETTVDSDSDGEFDFQDTDSDSDGIADSLETTEDTDSDGVFDFLETDSDSDGIADSLETTQDSDSDGIFDFQETDADSDGIADSLETTADTDSDGVFDFQDTDSDSDGIADSLETTNDSDSDGIFDFLETDSDSDGIADSLETTQDSDSDGIFDFQETDADSDGIADSLETTADTDSDGVFDFQDTDSDSDGIADSLETTADTDSDGTFDFLDTDADSDGIADSLETTQDSDSDGIFDFQETDADSDGIADSLETTNDSDSDGIFDFQDTDSDSDGIADSLETTVDSDSDGIVDFLDTDSDSDGIADSLETTVDSDSDGIFDFLDTDSDSDGIADSLESTNDIDSDGVFDYLLPPFTPTTVDPEPTTEEPPVVEPPVEQPGDVPVVEEARPFTDIAALLSIGNTNRGFALVNTFEEPEFTFIDDLVRVDPGKRYTFITEDGLFNGIGQSEVEQDISEYIHLTVTDQWEVYENFYGQGVNQELIRYIEGVLPRFDQHVDIEKGNNRWYVIPYLLEGYECLSIDSTGACEVPVIERMLDGIAEYDVESENNYQYIAVDNIQLENELSDSEWLEKLLGEQGHEYELNKFDLLTNKIEKS